jgi:hypothetical protein
VQRTILDSRRAAPLRVYAIWFNMYPGDARDRWRDTLLTDARVHQYWDESRATGRLYLQLLPQIWDKRASDTILPQSDALWDAFLLYESGARWGGQPPVPFVWGATILQTAAGLEGALKALRTP